MAMLVSLMASMVALVSCAQDSQEDSMSSAAVTSAAGGDALGSSVLVLNRFYMAVHVVSVRRAVTLLFRDLAEVIHLESGQYANYDFESWREISQMRASFKEPHQDWIRAVNFELEVPRVIRLLFYERSPKQAIRFNRRNIFARDENRCQYCGKRFPTSELSLDHVVPRSRGGETSWENIVCSCVKCNVRKGGRTPQEAHMKLFRLPVKPKRSPLLSVKLGNPKYESWKSFLDNAYWSVDLK
jgi:5-methylcytosine-specific restriction endonuclease McrA